MLRYHEDGPVRTEGAPGYPHCAVLSDSKLAWNNCDIDAFEFVGIVYGGEIKRDLAYSGDKGSDFARLGV
jgi:hypothetical protein